MGMWNKLFGGAEGCREAMCQSYEKHVRLAARQGNFDGVDSPHSRGLYGALETRYIVGGRPAPEVVLWGELAPFLAMMEDIGLKALVEYVVYQEYPPGSTDVSWLREVINSALRSWIDDEWLAVAGAGWVNQVAWVALLDSDTQERLERVMMGLGDEEVDWP